MRPDERWLWLDDTLPPGDASVAIWRAYPGCYFISHGSMMSGPYEDATILRAVRVACTPTIDGCEKGPHRPGFAALEDLRPIDRGPKWQEVILDDLPASTTRYDAVALEPVAGCCTTDDSLPKIDWQPPYDCDAAGEVEHRLTGILTRSWNAHPRGSLVLANDENLIDGFAIVDTATDR